MMSAFRVLAKLRRYRGTAFDFFARSPERKMERALIGEYEAVIAEVLERLTPQNYEVAVDLASIPEHIRGYGYIKERHVKDAKVRERALLAQLRDAKVPSSKAPVVVHVA
jgi:indolepyruvate ferredoxin oxidoreductase